MQHAAPDVRIDQQSPMAAVRKGVRQVSGDKRFAISRSRAGHGDEQGRAPAMGVYQVQADAPESLHDLVDVFRYAAPTAPMR
ncbi:MAG: hypothetical protein DMD34_13410 [Gemmatimonadetes bacterium]|nr:MAG: hypothetical protein DMD34_13410 [Gemmatimonadota bacterium]